MFIEVHGTYHHVTERELRERCVVVIDLLRATTCIVEAMVNGARKIIPTEDVSEAMAVTRTLDRNDRVLAGERGGNPLNGFDIGNSPREFSPATVCGKSVVMSTTNGTAAIQRARDAKSVLIGALLNRTAVARKISEFGDDTALLCAGTEGKISTDDLYCAGGVLTALRESGQDFETNDLGMVCELVYKSGKADPSIVLESHHARHLRELGYGDDVEYCLREDVTECVPSCTGGIISLSAVPYAEVI